MGSEPGQSLGGGAARRFGHHFIVGPRADGHGDVHPSAMQMPVLGDCLIDEDVLPAADQQNRNGAAVQCPVIRIGSQNGSSTSGCSIQDSYQVDRSPNS